MKYSKNYTEISLFPQKESSKIGYLHLSVMVAWHDSGWNGKACLDPAKNVYCESFGFVRKHKWSNGKLRCFKDSVPCEFENAIFSFDPNRPSHLKSAAFGGLGASNTEVGKFIFPLISQNSSLIFVFCRENPLSEEKIICACLKPSFLIKTWYNNWPSVEAKITPEDIIFVIPYQEIAKVMQGYSSFPKDFIFEIPKTHKSIFRGMMSILKPEEAIPILFQALDILGKIKKWLTDHKEFDPDIFNRRIDIDAYIERTQNEIRRLSEHRLEYPGILGLLWYLDIPNYANYFKAVMDKREEDFLQALKVFLEHKLEGNWPKFFSDFGVYYALDGIQVKEVMCQFSPSDLTENPYLLCEDFKVPYKNGSPVCSPISFDLIDSGEKRRLKENFNLLSSQRIRAFLIQALKDALESGHTSVPENLMHHYCTRINSLLPEDRRFPDINFLLSQENVLQEKIRAETFNNNKFFSLSEVRRWDKEIELKIKELSSKSYDINILLSEIKKLLPNNKPKHLTDKEYEEAILEQAEAIRKVAKHGLCVITGPAGAGKTTVLRSILNILQCAKVLLTAPTGKATARIREIINKDNNLVGIYPEIRTIHSFLASKGAFDPTFFLPKPARAPEYYDLVVIDETSMVDTRLFWAFLKSINPNRLVLIGDTRQLPPVEAGKPFYDLVNYLKNEMSDLVVELSHRVRSLPECKEIIFESDEWKDKLQKVADKNLLNADKAQIITPFRTKGEINSQEINMLFVEDRKSKFSEGDKVIQLINDWQRLLIPKSSGRHGVFNGMMGRYCKGNYVELFPPDEGFKFKMKEDQVDLAFCITVHKAQGSEWNMVIVVLPSEAKNFMSNELLYTALTRAKKHLTLLIDKALIKESSFQKLLEQCKTEEWDIETVCDIMQGEIENRYTLLFKLPI